MNRIQRKQAIATLIKKGRPDLANQVAFTSAAMKRPGPFITLSGKPGVWQVVAFQPYQNKGTPGTRRVGELAWCRIQKVTKKGKLTGKEFYAYLFENNTISVAWKSRQEMRHEYKEVPKPGPATAALLKKGRPDLANQVAKTPVTAANKAFLNLGKKLATALDRTREFQEDVENEVFDPDSEIASFSSDLSKKMQPLWSAILTAAKDVPSLANQAKNSDAAADDSSLDTDLDDMMDLWDMVGSAAKRARKVGL